MNSFLALVGAVSAVGLAQIVPVRRVRLAMVGASSLVGGCAAFALLVHDASQQSWEIPALSESAAWAAQTATPAALTAEAEDPTNQALGRRGSDQVELELESSVIYPDDRPAWVEADFTHETGEVQRVAVASGPYLRKQEALRALDDELVKATSLYINEYLGSSSAATLVPIDATFIKERLIKPGHIYSERLVVSVGPVHQVHALLEFDPSFRKLLDDRWQKVVMTGRLLKLGVIAAGVLLALSVVFGYFRADTATRGYYTTRLQLVSATAILALVAGGVVLLRSL